MSHKFSSYQNTKTMISNSSTLRACSVGFIDAAGKVTGYHTANQSGDRYTTTVLRQVAHVAICVLSDMKDIERQGVVI